MSTVLENPTAKIVDGSDGLLLEVDGQIVPNYDATMHPFQEGEVVTGHVVRIDHDEVLVDIGYKSEGVIPANELSIRKSVDPHDEVTLGEEVDALVLTKEDQDGRLIMSKKRARFEKAWRRIEAAAESGEPVEGTVIEVVKGGLIIDLGVRGFLPASLVDIRRVPNLDEYMGTQIECKVIELNRSRNNVVLSRRAVLEEERKEVRQQILDRLQPGLVVEGQISNIVDFGAFVDLDGIDGLIHISELSWSHVNHPSEVLEIGDTVQVKVLDIDRDRQRISLGLKQTQEDPWQRIVNTYNIGDELAGTVTKVVTFGAFVEILDGVEGLVHISELAPHHVENPREIVQPGDELRVKILEIDSERRACRSRPSASRARSCRCGGSSPSPTPRCEQPADAPEQPEPDAEVRAAGGCAERSAEADAAADAPAASRSRAAPSPRPSPSRPSPRSRRWPTRPPRPSRSPQPPRRRPTPQRTTGSRQPASSGAAVGVPFVGLTGGIGAGKSTALAALAELGAAVIDADAIVHELYGTAEVRDAVRARFGDEVFAGGRGRPRGARAARVRGRRRPRVARGAAVAARRRARRGVPRRRGPREPPPPRGGRRGAAAVRGGRRGALRRDDRGRRRRRAPRGARRGPRHGGARAARGAPAAAGREGAARALRGRQRRHRSRSCASGCASVLAEIAS